MSGLTDESTYLSSLPGGIFSKWQALFTLYLDLADLNSFADIQNTKWVIPCEGKQAHVNLKDSSPLLQVALKYAHSLVQTFLGLYKGVNVVMLHQHYHKQIAESHLETNFPSL